MSFSKVEHRKVKQTHTKEQITNKNILREKNLPCFTSSLMRKIKHLESHLQQVETFAEPKVELEQYPTTPHLASRVLFAAREDIVDKKVVDLGCGTGVLTIGAYLLECK